MSNFSSRNDKQLVSQLIDNDVKAFDELFHRYGDRLFRFSFSLLKNQEDSKEIVQETFYKIWNKRNEIDSSKSFKSFLFTVSYNLIMDQLRLRLKDKEFRQFLEVNFKDNSFCTDHSSDYNFLNHQISEIIEKLPGKRKKIFQLSREKGLSHQEIAEQLGISVKTVENQINLTLKHMRQQLGKDILPVLLFFSLFL
ncbi:RNA polymerase sigma-70 factor [Maribellus comscasis]|uniref:RNA polymerase sigma-70 factor n=1 Tax=Maribellus comscasis TaxID=2681766 RepID=A0A6I6JSM2_9BACT|nr:RNA polymerase sigma-70 factor [Maribellus comscasis]QGY44078.1 RNA polymerase sigma-70 factor [Maribellus comscasis]